MHEVLKKVKPKLIISAVRGPFEDQIDLHQQLIEHVKLYNCRLLFLSSSNVFDAFHNYPSYEFDKTLSESVYGRLKIKIENEQNMGQLGTLSTLWSIWVMQGPYWRRRSAKRRGPFISGHRGA